MKSRQYLPYITGLKGISCFFIMVGHFSGIIKYISSAPFDITNLMLFCETVFGLILRESFWLSLFFVSSGYLLAQTTIINIKDLILKCIKRFLRLGIPILFSSAVIFILLSLIGLHNQATSCYFMNAWYQNAYSTPLTILDIFKSPFDVLILNRCIFNSPYWVLREMFVASLMIYTWLYIRDCLICNHLIRFFIEMIMLWFGYNFSDVIYACFIGMVFANYRTFYHKLLPPQYFYGKAISVLLVLLSFKIDWVLFFSLLIYTIPYFSLFDNLLSYRIPSYFGKISWGIYSFHWPMICSLGAYILLVCFPIYGIWKATILASSITAFATVILSHIYTNTFEKWSTKLTAQITSQIQRIISREGSTLAR